MIISESMAQKWSSLFGAGIYENWPVDVFDKCGDPEDAVYRTDREIEQKAEVTRMTVAEYAKSVFERVD